MRGYLLGADQRFVEGDVLNLRHRRVQIILSAFAVARGAKQPLDVQSLSVHDGADGVVKRQVLAAGERLKLHDKRVGGQRPGGDEHCARLPIPDCRLSNLYPS